MVVILGQGVVEDLTFSGVDSNSCVFKQGVVDVGFTPLIVCKSGVVGGRSCHRHRVEATKDSKM